MLNPLTHRKILKKGRPGRATIVASSPPSRKATTFNMAMTLQVHAEGVTPYEVEDQWWVKSADTELLGAFPIPVKVDRDAPELVAIDWEQFRREADERKRERRDALGASRPGSIDLGGITVQFGDATAGEAGADPTADETIAMLERLQALRASGALTEEEFAEQKRQVLEG